ncbi:MAG: DUF6414 family protein [Janthinobacterium lividum]
MPNETRVIRDFIYMDVDRLNSLYSQAFSGVVPQILKSRSYERTNTEGIESVPDESPQSLLAQRLVTEARNETKNVILYDYLYTQFEDGVTDSIVQPQGLTRDNFAALLDGAFLIKVEGNAEIEDYERLAYSSEQFPILASDIA